MDKLKKKNAVIVYSRSLMEAKFYYFLTKKKFNNLDIYHFVFSVEVFNYLKKRKQKVFSVFDKNKKNISKKRIIIYKKDLLHEQREFNLDKKDLFNLKKKYKKYYHSIIENLSLLKLRYKKIILIQEIGGFISHNVVFNISKKLKLNHYFIEPGFPANFFFILKNSYFFKKEINLKNKKIDYKTINDVLSYKTLSFIKEHKRKYLKNYLKIFNFYNLRRLIIKFSNKYILSQKEDYDYLFKYIAKHFTMLSNFIFNKKLYSSTLPEKFIYFPLHVYNDMALTIRAPQYLNQIKLINKIYKLIPKNYKLVIKEHPSNVGGYNFENIKKLISESKINLIYPYINNYEIMKKSSLVITVNSKTGVESLILGKKLITLANSFYFHFDGSIKTKLDKKEILNLLNKKDRNNKNEFNKILNYIQNISHKGEMFNLKNKNIFIFRKSLKEFFKKELFDFS